MVQRKSKRQRLNNGPRSDVLPFTIPKVFPNEPSDAATEEDKRNWKGWCEIESEPVKYVRVVIGTGLLISFRPFSM